jgi:hypothetical protein
MIVGIVATGTGTAVVRQFAEADSVAQGLTDFVNSYTPPLNPADYIAFDSGWGSYQYPAPGYQWSYNRDTDTLLQSQIPVAAEYSEIETIPKTGGAAEDTLPAALTANAVRRVDYKNNTPNLKIKRTGSDTINGNSADLENLPDGSYEAVPDGQTDWRVRAIATRSFDAVVRPDGTGDYTSVSAAITAGAKSVFITSGTYIEAGPMVLPEDAALIGESPGSVVMVLVNNNPITFSGVARRTTAGTITVTSGNTAVVGVGTTFTDVADGDFIKIGASYFGIQTVTDDTNIVLTDAYHGASYTGAFVAQSMATGATLQNLIIANSVTHGIVLEQGFHVALQNCLVIRCGANGSTSSFKIDRCSEVHAIGFVVEHAGECGIEVVDSTLIRLETNAVKNSVLHGFHIKGCMDISVDAAMCMSNGDCGIAIDAASSRVGLSECIVNQNALHGVVVGNDCLVSGCTFFGNGGDGVRVVTVDNAIVDGCRCGDNTGTGVTVEAGADDAMVTSNNLIGNLGGGLTDLGTNTTAANNKV